MRKSGWWAIALAAVLGVPSPARADAADALVQVVGEAVVRVLVYGAVFAIAPRDEGPQGSALPDWSGAAQGEAVTACGLRLEASLSGNARANFLNVEVQSARSSWAGIAPARITLGGASFRATPDTPEAPLVPARSSSSFHYELSKWRFEDARSLDLVVPVLLPHGGRCQLGLRLRRDPSAPKDDRSYVAFAPRELSVGVNAHFLAQGSLRPFASDPHAGLSISWLRFWRPQYGISFEIGLDQLDRFEGRSALGGYFLTGFVYRVYPSPRWALSYEAGLGFYLLPQRVDERSNGAILMRQKLKLELLPASDEPPRFSVGPALIHSLFPVVGPTSGGTGQMLALGLDFTAGG